MRSAPFWDFTTTTTRVVSHPRFRTTYRLHLLGLLDPLKMEREFVPKIR